MAGPERCRLLRYHRSSGRPGIRGAHPGLPAAGTVAACSPGICSWVVKAVTFGAFEA